MPDKESVLKLYEAAPLKFGKDWNTSLEKKDTVNKEGRKN